MRALSDEFKKRVLQLHGAQGQEWLDLMPGRLRTLEQLWGVRVSHRVEPLNYHYVAFARRSDGTDAMLKLGVPGETIDREAQCLRHFDGRAAPRLLEHDPALGAMLLERIRPGTSLKSLDDGEAVAAASAVMLRLHAPGAPSTGFPTVLDWWKGFERLRDRFAGGTGPLPLGLVAQAQALFADLANSMEDPVLLHGDLHHENILAATREPWVAIDPQGVIGEPAYEVGAFLRNPLPDVLDWPNLTGIMARRVTLFSETLGYDTRRVAGWGFAQAVLSAIWSLEDHGSGWEAPIALAQSLRDARSV